MTSHKIASIIINWNSKKNTIDCIKSLLKLSLNDISQQIILVDNASSDNTVKDIKKLFPQVTVIANRDNLGFARACNIGVKKALKNGIDYVWLINNDTIVDKEALRALITCMEDSAAIAASSKIYFAPGYEYHKDRYTKKDLGKVIWYAGGKIDWQNMYTFHRGVDDVDNGQFEESIVTDFVTGCSMIVRSDFIKKYGLFDEKFYLYLEDTDFSLKAKKQGYKLIYCPKSLIWHKNAGSTGKPGNPIHEYYMTRNRLLIGIRYASFRTKLALMRELFRFVFSDNRVKKKAVIDALLGRYGKQFTPKKYQS